MTGFSFWIFSWFFDRSTFNVILFAQLRIDCKSIYVASNWKFWKSFLKPVDKITFRNSVCAIYNNHAKQEDRDILTEMHFVSIRRLNFCVFCCFHDWALNIIVNLQPVYNVLTICNKKFQFFNFMSFQWAEENINTVTSKAKKIRNRSSTARWCCAVDICLVYAVWSREQIRNLHRQGSIKLTTSYSLTSKKFFNVSICYNWVRMLKLPRQVQ